MFNHFSIIFGITSYIFSAMGYFLNPAGYILAMVFAGIGIFFGIKATKDKRGLGLIISSMALMLSSMMVLLMISFMV